MTAWGPRHPGSSEPGDKHLKAVCACAAEARGGCQTCQDNIFGELQFQAGDLSFSLHKTASTSPQPGEKPLECLANLEAVGDKESAAREAGNHFSTRALA